MHIHDLSAVIAQSDSLSGSVLFARPEPVSTVTSTYVPQQLNTETTIRVIRERMRAGQNALFVASQPFHRDPAYQDEVLRTAERRGARIGVQMSWARPYDLAPWLDGRTGAVDLGFFPLRAPGPAFDRLGDVMEAAHSHGLATAISMTGDDTSALHSLLESHDIGLVRNTALFGQRWHSATIEDKLGGIYDVYIHSRRRPAWIVSRPLCQAASGILTPEAVMLVMLALPGSLMLTPYSTRMPEHVRTALRIRAERRLSDGTIAVYTSEQLHEPFTDVVYFVTGTTHVVANFSPDVMSIAGHHEVLTHSGAVRRDDDGAWLLPPGHTLWLERKTK